MFNLIKRFLAWIIRIVAMLVGAVGLLMLVFGLIGGEQDLVVPGAVMAGVGIVVGIIASKVGHKAKVAGKHNQIAKCKKCGASLAGATYRYEYNLSKATTAPISGLLQVPVGITIYCPNCGKDKYLYETVEVAGTGDVEGDVVDAIRDMMNEYCNG